MCIRDRLCHHVGAREGLAVQLGGNTLFKMQGDVGGLVGSLLGGHTQLQEPGLVVLRLVGGILQIQALVGQVPQVLILGVVGFTVDLQRNVVSLCIVDFFVTALDSINSRRECKYATCKML